MRRMPGNVLTQGWMGVLDGGLQQLFSDFLIGEGYSEQDAMEAVHHFSRDSARTPIPWTADKNAGFTTGVPWLRINDDYKTCNAAEESVLSDNTILIVL